MSEVKRPLEDSADTPELKRQKPEVDSTPDRGIQEHDVGITAYLSKDVGGFTGTLKQRYTDFLVNEIGLDGEVIHFNDDGIMDKKERRRQRREQERESAPEAKPEPRAEPKAFVLGEDKRAELVEHFGEEEVSRIVELTKSPGNFESSKVIADKTTRGKIHQLVREAFEGKLETKTTAENTFHFSLNNNRQRSNRFKDPQDSMDENGVENWGLGPFKPFLHFNLYKENKDTMEVASLLTRFLKTQPKLVRFAGTKDRRGVTVQRMCLSKYKVERVNALNKTLRGVKLGGFSYEDTSLKLGDLLGNEFVITLRDVESLSDSSIEGVMESSVKSLNETGFINYYGMQRFGTFSVSTHSIGKEILLSKWASAANLILSVQELALPDSVMARRIWDDSRDAAQALELMPKKCIAEWSLLKHLSQCQKTEAGDFSDQDYFNALMKIPRNLRIMYGHAYQSYVWNCVTSRRMELFGREVVAGDLVLDDSAPADEKPVGNEDEDFEEDVRLDKFQRARAITQEEADAKKFTIFDIVLPTPGFDINYPTNEELYNTYKSVMAEDGMDPAEMYRKVREFSFAGSYRKILSRAKNLEYEIRRYDNPVEQLVYTDFELLMMRKKNGEPVSQIIPQGPGEQRTAVILKLQLDTSAYATMALREIMKADTSRRGDMCDVKAQ